MSLMQVNKFCFFVY